MWLQNLSHVALSLAILLQTSSSSPITSPSSSSLGPRGSDPFSPANWPYPAKVFGDSTDWGGIHIHDPSIVKHGSNFYLFGTHRRITIARSPTLHGPWKFLGSVVPNNQSIIDLPGRDDLWAPDVIKIHGVYHCYYSVSAFGSQNSAIGLATSKSLLPGTWTDHGQVIRSYNPNNPLPPGTQIPTPPTPWTITNAIDAQVVKDLKTGKHLLNWGSWWSNVWQLELASNFSAPASSPITSAPHQIALDPTPPQPMEGPYIHFSPETNFYYLYVSHGLCCGFNNTLPNLPAPGAEYKIKVGRSLSATGPYLDRSGKDMAQGGGDVILGSHGWVYGPGGQGVIRTGGKDVLYYHYVDTRVSYIDEDKLLGWNVVKYVEGWPVLV